MRLCSDAVHLHLRRSTNLGSSEDSRVVLKVSWCIRPCRGVQAIGRFRISTVDDDALRTMCPSPAVEQEGIDIAGLATLAVLIYFTAESYNSIVIDADGTLLLHQL